MQSRQTGSKVGACIGYGAFLLVAGSWLAVSWHQWHGAAGWWRDYQRDWSDAATYNPEAVRHADERAFLLDMLIVAVTVAALGLLIVFARRRGRGPQVAGAIGGVAMLVTLAIAASGASGDQLIANCHQRNPATYQEGTGLWLRGWSIVDGGSVAIWRGGDETRRIVC